MALHERKVERPPGQANHRHINELLLQEELEHRNVPVHRTLQHKNVHPRLVVAVDQVPAAKWQFVYALHVPGGALREFHPGRVAGHPGHGHGVKHRVQAQAHRLERQHQLDQCQHKQQRTPEQGVHRQQHECNGAANKGGQESEHGVVFLSWFSGCREYACWSPIVRAVGGFVYGVNCSSTSSHQ